MSSTGTILLTITVSAGLRLCITGGALRLRFANSIHTNLPCPTTRRAGPPTAIIAAFFAGAVGSAASIVVANISTI